ncbi:probable glycosyltransferase At5g03795 [Cynara cardunculus var. scolymus]|uniref:probable glycosyltransferase At5g03795 n=1 Tax=Cynara cardunculus var. scolymus TaxID=59895 RepID=UPI000D62AEDB|nr:probable glycosyltransferase At5g03795 [Cynara cardunculus var. scolymus]
MDNGFLHYLYAKRTTKWIWLFGITFAVVLTVQYSELPIFSGISFLLSGARSHDSNDSYSGDNRSIINSEAPLSSKEDIGTKSNSSINSTEKSTKNGSSLSILSMDDKKKPKMETLPVMSISQMNELLQTGRSSPHLVPSQSSSLVDQQLLEAKSQIENAGITNNDTELYAPIYRNVSMFKRSYEMMEQMLKVYIYKDGEKPIFHDWILEGIYASEGWFLKLMEANKQFVTEDPSEAHLFYIPFSSRLLELTLYVPHSHSRNNLIQFMKNHTEMLITKYPFWNRTDGSDHFLAGCHDWAPAETRGRLLNTIRALCNADIRTGFNIGKDVSLPTTYVRSAKNPLKDVGGEPSSKRTILAFFAGYMHGYVRPVLLSHWGNDTDMRIFGRMPHVKGNKNYIDHMKTSKYCICARGFAVHSPRVVESLFYNCVPVIISDNYVPPFFEVLNWESFAVFILEKDIPNLKTVLLSIPEETYLEMYERVKKVREHFFWHSEPIKYDSFHMVLHSVWYNRVLGTNLS